MPYGLEYILYNTPQKSLCRFKRQINTFIYCKIFKVKGIRYEI